MICKAKILSQHQVNVSIHISHINVLIQQTVGPKSIIKTLKTAYSYRFLYKSGFRRNLNFNICVQKVYISMECYVTK